MVEPLIPFSPMEPKSFKEAFDDPNYGFQIKWDGVRILAHINEGKIELFNRKKNIRTKQYPEIVSALPQIFKKNVILDGEMITLQRGKPSFSQLIRRDFATDIKTIKKLTEKIPITYVVFDILYNDVNDLTSEPFNIRDKLLKSLIKPMESIVVTDTFPYKGKGLFSVIKEAELEGIVAKKLDSNYQIGKKSSSWLKIKNWRTLNTFIGGYLTEGIEIRSLYLGTFENGDFVYIGRAGSGINRQQSLELFESLQNSISVNCPFVNQPAVAKSENPTWVNPSIEVIIKYMDFTDDGHIRHPVIKKVLL
ncbi:MAG: DNA ligase [Tepidanaerobacteraceae bacterium]